MTKPISVIFVGTPEFAVPSLEALVADAAYDVQLVITQPDKPVGRKQILTPPPVKIAAIRLGIPVEQPEDINNFQFSIFNFQFLITVAYGQLLKQNVLDQPSIAAINVHPSLLPIWRGAIPLQSALLAGDKQTGVTIQMMTQKLDAGDILAQQSTPIENRETITTLHDRLAVLSAALLTETLTQPLAPTSQDESNVTLCKKLSREDGEVDPLHMTAEEIDRRVRALVPWPGVTCTVKEQDVKLLRTSIEETKDSFAVECADNTILHIEELQSPGKTPLTGAQWALGH